MITLLFPFACCVAVHWKKPGYDTVVGSPPPVHETHFPVDFSKISNSVSYCSFPKFSLRSYRRLRDRRVTFVPRSISQTPSRHTRPTWFVVDTTTPLLRSSRVLRSLDSPALTGTEGDLCLHKSQVKFREQHV